MALPHNMSHNSHNLIPSGPGFKPKDEKFQPAKAGGHGCKNCGDDVPFNNKMKVTADKSHYHDFSKMTGMEGEFKKKDAANEYLSNRVKQGPTVHHYSRGTIISKSSKVKNQEYK